MGTTFHMPTPLSSQAMVREQAAQSSSPPDLRMQYLRQIHANHEVSTCAGRPTSLGIKECPWQGPMQTVSEGA